MYLRKSSEAEDRQQLSIPAQERELRELAARQGLTVIGKPIAEAMSAKRPGRPGFAALMETLSKRKADGVLVWALDRLARNPVDGGALMWALGERQIQAIVAPDRTYTGSGDDKLLMSIMFGMATKYSDDLSKNVRRGNREALLAGRWPSQVPIGYMRSQPDKNIVPDPDRWSKVREMWDLRLHRHSVESIHAHARDVVHLVTPPRNTQGRRPLSLSETYRLFTSSFYVGRMQFGGEEFAGVHTPMVSEAEFRQVRAMSSARSAAPSSAALQFRWARLLRCGTCGAAVTAENKINRHGKHYVYYHCSRKQRAKGFCPERCIEGSDVDTSMADFVDSLNLPEDVYLMSLDELRYQLEKGSDLRSRRDRASALRKRLSGLEGTITNLRHMRAEREISAEDFRADLLHYSTERDIVQEQLTEVERGTVIEPFLATLSSLRNAKSRFEAADDPKKREFLLDVSSNLSVKDRKVLAVAKEPIESLRVLPKVPTKWAVSEIVRTLLDYKTDPEVLNPN